MNPLFLFSAYDKEANTIIKNKTEIPEKREVVLSIFNSESQPVFAKVELPNSILKQRIVRKIDSHKKKNFYFVTPQKTKLEDFKIEIMDLDSNERLLKRKREEVLEKGKEKVSASQPKRACIDLISGRDSDYAYEMKARVSSGIIPSFERTSMPVIFHKFFDMVAKNIIHEEAALDPTHEMLINKKNGGEKKIMFVCFVKSGDGTLIPFIKEGAPAINSTVTKILEVGEKAAIGSFSPASSKDGKVIIKYLVANIPVQRDQIFYKKIELNVKKD